MRRGYDTAEEAAAEAVADLEPGEIATMLVCQGAPRCDYLGEEAIAQQEQGCVWCERRTYTCDGLVGTDAPSEA